MPPSIPAAAAPPAASGAFAFPTVPVTLPTTPLEAPDEVVREPLLELRALREPPFLELALREELRAAAERLEPELEFARFADDDLEPELFELLLLLERGFEEL